MRPAQIAGHLQVLNADAELSGRHNDAVLLAQAAAYLVEYEGIVHKLDGAAVLQRLNGDRIKQLQADLERAEIRLVNLEADLLLYKSRLGEA